MKRSWIITAIIIFAVVVAIFFYSSKGNTNLSTTSTSESDIITIVDSNQKVNDLVIEDLKLGSGAEAIAGKKVTVNYKGTLTNGTQFDSSYDRGEPFSFVLGAGEVIKGWDDGIVGMKVGGSRKLTIAPNLGYGDRAAGQIPGNSTLVFEVELLKVE